MASVEQLIEPLRNSPHLRTAVARLQREITEEQARRERFYEEMTPEQKVEFIHGNVVLHSPARNRHLDATMRLATVLKTYVGLKKLGVVKVEKCLCVFPRNDYEPDVVFFGRAKADDFTPETMKFPVPDLAVEVLSESTEARDRGVKFEDYAANGVEEYWLVDTSSNTLEQYLLGSQGEYALHMKSTSGAGTQPCSCRARARDRGDFRRGSQSSTAPKAYE